MRAGALAALAILAAGAGPALAHVEVVPNRVAQGEAVEFTIRVPNERDLPTTRVRVDFPPQITVFSVAAPPAGWTARIVVGPDQRLRSVVYRGRIPVAQYADFEVLGTPFEAGAATWKAFQTYADGAVKPWTGPPEQPGAAASESGPTDPGPAAVVTVAEPGEDVGTASGTNGSDDSGAAIWLGVIAIAISAMCLLALGFLWSTRPARLPGGDEQT